MSKKCIGCGALLQSDNEKALGYVSKDVYDKALYCERCFKVIHYNEKVVTKLDNINKEIINKLSKFDGLVYFMVDFLNINTETMNTFNSIKNFKCLVISKLDLLPKSFKEKKIISFIKKTYNVKEDILFVSSKKNINTKFILNCAISNGFKKVCFTGYTNAGKSTLVNKILENNNIESSITTSLNPNTTVDFIEIKLNDIKLYDSPGFALNRNIYAADDFKLIKKLNSKKMLKPITYQAKDSSSIFIEDLFRLSPSIKNSLTFYMSNDLNIYRLFDSNKLLDLDYKELSIDDNSDLVIKGLGFINIKKKCTIKVYSNYLDLIEIRKAIF